MSFPSKQKIFVRLLLNIIFQTFGQILSINWKKGSQYWVFFAASLLKFRKKIRKRRERGASREQVNSVAPVQQKFAYDDPLFFQEKLVSEKVIYGAKVE